MTEKIKQGQFEVIDSFAIKKRNEFYLIGNLREGIVQEDWFVNVPFNSSLALTLRISGIEEVEISSDENKYKLLIVTGDEETIEMLLALNIGSEYLDVTIVGED